MARLLLWVVAALMVAGLGAATTSAQNVRGGLHERISRPSDRSPSRLIGGRFTRGSATEAIQVNRQTPLIGQQQMAFRGTRRQSRYAATLQVARVGLMSGMGLSATSSVLRPSQLQSNSVISGLNETLSLGRGLPGVARTYVPAATAHEYTPRPGATRFSDFFGLEPSEQESPAEPVRAMAERVEAVVDERVERAEKQGMELFRAATIEARDPRTGQYPSCVDCEEKLRHAVQKLTLVDELDNDSYIAPLLIAHAALEQEKPMYATNKLIDAWRRNPDILQKRGELVEYFGDVPENGTRSPYLEGQLRRYLRTGDLNPTSPTAHALAAYCAWRLDDPVRLEQAAVRAVEAMSDAAVTMPDLMNFVVALQNTK